MSGTTPPCPFCSPRAEWIFHAGPATLGLWSAEPATPGHALLVPKRHISGWPEATQAEREELIAGIEIARAAIASQHEPDGYTIGFDEGAAAGQAVAHLHLQLIPRYGAASSNGIGAPEGAARSRYPSSQHTPALVAADRDDEAATLSRLEETAPHLRALIAGEEDPLLPHLRAHLERATRADFAVAFTLTSGIQLLRPHLIGLLDRSTEAQLRFLTGDYLGVTDPDALLHLLDIQEQYAGQAQIRVFESATGSFHPKSYIFREGPVPQGSTGAPAGAGIALVGSSNLTRPALTNGVEWNYRAVTSRDREGFADVAAQFEHLFTHPKTQPLDAAWIERYRTRRPGLRSVPERAAAPAEEPPEPPPTAHEIQLRALAALEETRAQGNTAGLVVLATGLGKTWLSAFDSARPEFQRVLFVAHREEILNQAMGTFRRIRPDAHLGLYTGQEKTPDAEIVFASIQTLGRSAHLRRFASDEFDYVVVDEFHHAAARTYRGLIDHFEPKFLLGLTATPERSDGGDLLALCQENLVFRCNLAEGIEADLLSPFHYFGVPDDVEYENIPWKSGRFNEEALTNAVATQARAQNALEQFQQRAGKRTLAFCCSKRHADFMRSYFQAAGIRTAAVHSGPTSDPRASSLEQLEEGKLQVVFAVDMFNEGVDIPHVDTVMMLRPTESRILWLQQLGRGLRKADGKSHLNVIDYIGNHRTFLLKPQTLFELAPGDANIDRQLDLLRQGKAELPPGCEVTYDLEALDILQSLLRVPKDQDALRFAYEDLRERNDARPTATELHHEGYKPRSTRKAYDSWFGFVDAMNDLSPGEQSAIREGAAAEFLKTLETTQMTKSYKMLVLLAMLAGGALANGMGIGDLVRGVRRIARRSAALRGELGAAFEDDDALKALLVQNPIAAWTGGKGTGGKRYFTYESEIFRPTFTVPGGSVDTYTELVRELVEWRLAEYLDREPSPGASGAVSGFTGRVSHAGDRAMLFLPERSKNPSIPEGWNRIRANDEELEANFVQVALNVVRRPGESENLLPEILRGWFGDSAGMPGTNARVSFQEEGSELVMAPVRRTGCVVGRSYMREEIPKLYGLTASPRAWQQGFVLQDDRMFLFVTLDKSGMPEEHRYRDRFLPENVFEWKSQNRHFQNHKHAKLMRDHVAQAIPALLFVRKTGKQDGTAAPFIFCGELEFMDWEGERPITIRWRLRTPLSKGLSELFDSEPQ